LSIGEKNKIDLFPLKFCHPTGGGPSHGDRQHAQKMAKITRVVREICSRLGRHIDTRTHAHTDTHITILRHRSCGRSNNLDSL